MVGEEGEISGGENILSRGVGEEGGEDNGESIDGIEIEGGGGEEGTLSLGGRVAEAALVTSEEPACFIVLLITRPHFKNNLEVSFLDALMKTLGVTSKFGQICSNTIPSTLP